MLVNATKKNITIKWNGYQITVKPDQKFHVVDILNVTSKEALALEDRFVKKYPGIIKVANADQPYVWQEPKTTAPAAPAEKEGEDEDAPKADLLDENRPRSFEDHSREELEAMAKSQNIKFTKKTSDAKLIEELKKKLDQEATDE